MTDPAKTAAIVGGGPAGLMAAEILSAAGFAVTVYDRMPSIGRKFLMAGRGGLNLTHSESLDAFAARYGEAESIARPLLDAFPPAALIAWAEGLGQETFVGSSGRVFPKAMKASPLLRAWLTRLREQGVQFRLRHEWFGWDDGALMFRDAAGAWLHTHADVTVLALGGASWPKLGSDGSWARILKKNGVAATPLQAANCGFTVPWSEIFRERFAGQPLKNAAFRFGGQTVRGEAMVTQYGIEGGAIYALSHVLRAALKQGETILQIDLRPDLSEAQLIDRLKKPRGKDLLTNYLRKALHLSPVEIGLLREHATFSAEPAALAKLIKNATVPLTSVQSLDRAISTAGGVPFAALDANLMLRRKPGVFVAGEMLDWDAPTGGYLLQACFATGVAAAKGALAFAEDR